MLPLKIGELVANVPIIQGGMGIGVSRSNLASAVAEEGGIGVISAVQIGFEEPDFKTNTKEANIRALEKEIKTARKLSPKGILGVNIMVAANEYKELVLTAVKEKIDLIICGAGLPTDLPKFIKDTKTKIAPIVSSSKAATLITKLWTKKYNYVPDLIIVEGPEAGGHLGFSKEDLENKTFKDLQDILKEVLESLVPFEKTYNTKIPVVVAGGIFDGKDIAKYLKLGASGVQMATRFVATEECDAHINFKKAYISSTIEDIKIIQSPVGMPGRAIYNKFLKNLTDNNTISKCYHCLKPCNPQNTPYCITEALINSVKGNTDEGLIFSGSNACRIHNIVTVKELIDSLIKETEECLN